MRKFAWFYKQAYHSFYGFISRAGPYQRSPQAWFSPRVDVFSYVPTISPVVHHEWGTAAILYIVTVQLGLGANGLMLVKYLLTAFIA